MPGPALRRRADPRVPAALPRRRRRRARALHADRRGQGPPGPLAQPADAELHRQPARGAAARGPRAGRRDRVGRPLPAADRALARVRVRTRATARRGTHAHRGGALAGGDGDRPAPVAEARAHRPALRAARAGRRGRRRAERRAHARQRHRHAPGGLRNAARARRGRPLRVRPSVGDGVARGQPRRRAAHVRRRADRAAGARDDGADESTSSRPSTGGRAQDWARAAVQSEDARGKANALPILEASTWPRHGPR